MEYQISKCFNIETSWGWAGPSSAANWDLLVLWLTFVSLYWLTLLGMGCQTNENRSWWSSTIFDKIPNFPKILRWRVKKLRTSYFLFHPFISVIGWYIGPPIPKCWSDSPYLKGLSFGIWFSTLPSLTIVLPPSFLAKFLLFCPIKSFERPIHVL